MIRKEDFSIVIRYTDSGSSIQVTHLPTGNVRTETEVSSGQVGPATDRLIRVLRSLLYSPHEIRLDSGRSEDGVFRRVVHLPTGIERSTPSGDT